MLFNYFTGSFKDPFEIPGLAHFCEHMLFMGTEKYPDEELYGKVINFYILYNFGKSSCLKNYF